MHVGVKKAISKRLGKKYLHTMVREFAKINKLSVQLTHKLKSYNELLFSVSRGYDTKAIAAMFPPDLQAEIYNDMHLPTVPRVPIRLRP